MADEPIEGLEALEPQQSQGPQYTEVEQQAMSQGWVPKEHWQGDPNAHRSAKDFIDRGEMIGKIRSQDRELTQIRQALNHLNDQNTKTYERGYAQAINELKVARKEALAEGDVLKADNIGDRIVEVRQEADRQIRAQKQRQEPAVDPTFEPWLDKNPWYSDPVMQKFADGLAVQYVAENKKAGQNVTLAQARDFVEIVVKEEFAHRFRPQQREVRGAANPDGGSRQATRGGNSAAQLSKVKSNLTDEERQIVKTMAKQTGMTEAQYLKIYSELD